MRCGNLVEDLPDHLWAGEPEIEKERTPSVNQSVTFCGPCNFCQFSCVVIKNNTQKNKTTLVSLAFPALVVISKITTF